MNQTTSVYAEIYDIVNENMNRSGKEFPYNKNTFLCDVGSTGYLCIQIFTVVQ
jgi:hypothetical protein